MAAKTAKVTLKSLHSEVNILKEDLEYVKKELKEAKEELKGIKELKDITNTEINSEKKDSSDQMFNCKQCDKSFDVRNRLKNHVQENHPQKIKCKSCKETFDKTCDLEVHIKRYHEPIGKYECNQCDKRFVLKWRLSKHQENHDSQKAKKCHYFNNNKICPFEDLGCMFQHSFSSMCKYGKNCLKKLCSFQHEKSIPATGDVNEVVDIIEEDLEEKFEKLTDDEQYESKMVVCDNLCRASYGYHKCSDEDYEEFVGCDVLNITNEFDIDCKPTEYFPCENCDERFVEFEKFKEHFSKYHIAEKLIKCTEDDCDFVANSVDVVIMHIGVNHYDLIRQN